MQRTTSVPLPMAVEELTAEWLTTALSIRQPGVVVSSVVVEHIIWGTATKILVSVDYRDSPAPGGPPSRLCVKGGFDAGVRELAMSSAYVREADFFDQVAPGLRIPLPRCWYTGRDEEQGQGIIVLDDLAATGCTFGEPTEPWPADRVAAALEVLAGLHAATWGADRERHPWLSEVSPVRQVADFFFTPGYWDRHFGGDDGPPAPAALLDRELVRDAFHALWRIEDSAVASISHGDPHLGNAYLDTAGRPAFLDWQGVCAAPPMDDVAYLIAGALTVQDRRASERDLVGHYLDARGAAGAPGSEFDTEWLDYRRHHLHGFLWATTGPMMQPRDRVFAMAERHIAAIEDHDTLALLR
ncbi:MAG: hypothetical protein QOI10_4046 [Solirubrobacterales bacterium]|jgi:hypothetical protein|nr:hypothetical protein [Solirubrobacterales bacterium]